MEKSPEKFCEFCTTYTIVRILSSLTGKLPVSNVVTSRSLDAMVEVKSPLWESDPDRLVVKPVGILVTILTQTPPPVPTVYRFMDVPNFVFS
jgi:hypothetical protein